MICPNPATQTSVFQGGIHHHEHHCKNVATNIHPDFHTCEVCGFCWQEES